VTAVERAAVLRVRVRVHDVAINGSPVRIGPADSYGEEENPM